MDRRRPPAADRASYTFLFLDELSEPAESAVAIGGAACLLAGVWLWWRKPADRPSAPSTGDGEGS
ncbi:hypothetical protein [Micromonospora aurantiaca (nom. illeg.)]|uniref:hypothetical protein n=1 Tax=Micromonospora aurantiaca (nom. illeg.) TaxID=47850 RepID=UPI003EB89F75